MIILFKRHEHTRWGSFWGFDTITGDFEAAVIPEPSMFVLWLIGLMSLGIVSRRRRRRA